MKVNLKMNPTIATPVTFTDEEDVDKPRIGINYEGNKLYAPMGLGWYGSLKGLYSNIYSGSHPALFGKTHKGEEKETGGLHVSYTTSDFINYNGVLQIDSAFWNTIDPSVTDIDITVQLGFVNKTTKKLDYFVNEDAARHLNYGDTGTYEFTAFQRGARSPNTYWASITFRISTRDEYDRIRCPGCVQDYSDGKVGDVVNVSIPSITEPFMTFTCTRSDRGKKYTLNVTKLTGEGPYEFGYFKGSEWIKLNDFTLGTITTTLPDEVQTRGFGTIFVPEVYLKKTGDEQVLFSFSTNSSGRAYGTFYMDSMAHNAIFE